MNYENLTEEQFNAMAEQLCAAWDTLEYIREEINSMKLVSPETLNICKSAHYRQQGIATTLGQDPNKEPKWPPVRKFKVGLTQLRTVEYITEVEVSAEDEIEAEALAFEMASKDADHWTSRLDWEENGESTEHERRLDDGTWRCEPV